MKFNVPLLPCSVEFRWRPLPPLRFKIRHLLAIVLLSGVGIYLVTQAIMHQLAMDFHRRLSADSPNEARWHLEQVASHHSAYLTTDLMLLVYVPTVGALVAVLLLGRLVNWLRRDTSGAEARRAETLGSVHKDATA